MDMLTMRMRWDPTPPLDLMEPMAQAAVERIKLELASLKLEQPDWTPFQMLREARRRATRQMVDALDVARARRYGLRFRD